MRNAPCRLSALLAVAWASSALAVHVTSPAGNFVVSAKDAEVARQVAEFAEHYRRVKALEWLGREVPDWDRPCTIDVRLTHGGAGGATSFAFDRGQILSQQMTVEGSLERVLNSVLPHEVTHTIFAARFRRPLPRWADEGGAVLSEDYQEIARHDLLCRQLINQGRMIPLKRLFVLTEYPKDVMALYAEGFSLANFLVSMVGKQQFLDLVEDGQTRGWDYACQRHTRFRSIDELEHSWIDWLRVGRGTGADGPPTLAGTMWNRPAGERVVRGRAPEEAAWPGLERSIAMEPARLPSPALNDPFPVTAPIPAVSGMPRTPASAASPPPAAILTQISEGERLARPERLPPATRDRSVDVAEANRRQAAPSSANRPRRLIPIAVGRTRRDHPFPAGGSTRAPTAHFNRNDAY